jgi:hypothetical protein
VHANFGLNAAAMKGVQQPGRSHCPCSWSCWVGCLVDKCCGLGG